MPIISGNVTALIGRTRARLYISALETHTSDGTLIIKEPTLVPVIDDWVDFEAPTGRALLIVHHTDGCQVSEIPLLIADGFTLADAVEAGRAEPVPADAVVDILHRIEELAANAGAVDLSPYALRSDVEGLASVESVEARIAEIELTPGAPGEKGEKGEKGETGEKGERGADGAQGAQGIQGIQGERGLPGIPGERGERGEQGIPGAPGAKGEKGDPGQPGAKGDKGDPGEPGQPGAQGERGEKGAKGDPGEPGAPGRDGADGAPGKPGTPGKDGITPTVEWQGTALVINGGDPVDLKGEPGQDGAPGERGERGEAGAPGQDGAPGERGADGAPGQPGAKGDPGQPGKPFTFEDFTPEQLAQLKGEKGEPGEKGETGAQGEPGAQGLPGEPGTPGPKGEKGEPGSPGADGVTPTLEWRGSALSINGAEPVELKGEPGQSLTYEWSGTALSINGGTPVELGGASGASGATSGNTLPDTGERLIALPADSPLQKLTIRRVGTFVTINAEWKYAGAATALADNLYSIPIGFRTKQTGACAIVHADGVSKGNAFAYNGTSLRAVTEQARYKKFTLKYDAHEAFPTTLPGTPA